MPATVVPPRMAPPPVQVVGALDLGPNTLKLILPVGSDPPARMAATEEDAISLPTLAVAGARTVNFGC